MKLSNFLIYLIVTIVITSPVVASNLVQASEERTIQLFPIADSFVSFESPQSNYGKELYLLAGYEKEKTIMDPTSFTVSPSRKFFEVYLPQNGQITGKYEVTAGGNKDIDFVITNSNVDDASSTIYLQQNRQTKAEFNFVAPYTGYFYLGFDNSFSWFTSKTVSLSGITLAMDPSNTFSTPILMLFDLSSIPPDATINKAVLSLSYIKQENLDMQDLVLKLFSSSQINWDENAIAYQNAPMSQQYIMESSSFSIPSGVTGGRQFAVDVKADVVRSLPNGKLSEMIEIIEGNNPTGFVYFNSRETENKPRLEISYTYASVGLSLSSSFLLEGQNLAVNVATDSPQGIGDVKIQYSTDQVKWYDINQIQGGSQYYVWTPSMTGQIYVRSVWEVSWGKGWYQSLSTVNGIYILPISVVVIVPILVIAIIIAVVGVRYWRRRSKRARRNYS